MHAGHIVVAYRIGRHSSGASHEPSGGIDRSQLLAFGLRERLGRIMPRW
jgi:hypothetical protein